MVSTPIFGLLCVSLILFHYAGVSLGMDAGPSNPRPSHRERRRTNDDRLFLLQKLREELEFLDTELSEANAYVFHAHEDIPKHIYTMWAERLRAKINSAYTRYQELIHIQNVPEHHSIHWYTYGYERRIAMRELTQAGYQWVELFPRSQNQSTILRSEHFNRLWQDIGNMNEEYTELAHNRHYMPRGSLERTLYNRVMRPLEARVHEELDYSRRLVLGQIEPQEREYYQPATTYWQLKNLFMINGLNWDHVHANIPPLVLPRQRNP